MANTVGDFVKMLYERECSVVVMLCGCEEEGVEVCAQYWPESTGTTAKYEELLFSTVKVTETDGVTQRLITITDSKVHVLCILMIHTFTHTHFIQCNTHISY